MQLPPGRPLAVPGLACPCCGNESFTQTAILWDELIASWELAEHEIDYLNRQQGLRCAACKSSLRTMTLAAGMMNAYGFRGLFREFVHTDPGRKLAVLEVNPAGQLTPHLRQLPGHKLVRYPAFDIQQMDLPDASFDAVVHSDTLEHVPDPALGLRECLRVLRPGGFCLYTVPIVVGRTSRTREGLPPAYHGTPKNPEDFRVITEYGDDVWQQPLEAGFREVRLYSLEYPSSVALICQKQPWRYTGERMVPEASDPQTFWEHVYRYRFAADYVRGKRVLDIACGEGYGTASLVKSGAAGVIGVDVSPEACEHARRKYGIDTRVGDAQSIPVADAAVDVVVSFETIEHVKDPAKFLAECRRVLAPGGTFVISTPNRDVYSAEGHHNPFHCAEMNRAEFLAAMAVDFTSVKLYSQHVQTAPYWTLRSLGAINSPWKNFAGYARVRKFVLPRSLRKKKMGVVADRERADITQTILRRDRLLADLFNPYAVRPESGHPAEAAMYFIAVAHTAP